jgi:hypothetical protein
MSEFVTTVLGAGLGLLTGVVLALLGSRQRLEVEYDIELRKHRIEAYQALWKILEPMAYYSPPSAVTYAVASDLSQALRSWYFEVGGLFLSEGSREAYFDLQKGLGGVIKEPLDARYRPLGPRRFERLRSLASTLRTASTQDVATRVKPKRTGPLLQSVVRRVRGPGGVEVTVRRGWLWGEDEQKCYSVLVQNPLIQPDSAREPCVLRDSTTALRPRTPDATRAWRALGNRRARQHHSGCLGRRAATGQDGTIRRHPGRVQTRTRR